MNLSDGGMPLFDVAPRLFLALVLGGAIGFNRELHDKPAGLRTHMLVALGSAAFVLLAVDFAHRTASVPAALDLDPSRVIQGVAGGLGFLGAGSII